ncbi:MAG: tetratricopeptide repeat protein [Bacteroidota bacterium]
MTLGLRSRLFLMVMFLAPVIAAPDADAAPRTDPSLPARIESYLPTDPVLVDLLVRSELAEAEGDGPAAIAWAESLATADPRSAFGCARVATLHEAVGEDVEALAWGDKALLRDSLCLDAAMLVARMHLRGGESDIAAQALTPPLRILGAPPEAYALRALAHELSRRYDAALADLKRTDELLPDFAWIATGILGLALEDGRLEEASQALRLALELRSDDPRVLHLGVSLAERTDDPALEETLLRSLALQPTARPSDIAAYGAFLVKTGKTAAFRQLLAWADAGAMKEADLRAQTGLALVQDGLYPQALETVGPLKSDPRALPVRARAYVSLGEEKKALDCYRRLLPGRTFTREESLVVAYLEIRVGDRARGVETLERARAARLETPRQVLAASLCYSLLGYPDEAVALIRESASRGVSSPSLFEQLGSAATVLGDSLVAQWAFERMRGLGKETSECLYFLATAELSQGRDENAIATLERAVRLNPKNGQAQLLLGKLRSDRGQLELARDALRSAASVPQTAYDANRALAKVCKSLRLDAEAREAESKSRGERPRTSAGLTLFQDR